MTVDIFQLSRRKPPIKNVKIQDKRVYEIMQQSPTRYRIISLGKAKQYHKKLK